ncbi:MAG: sigma-70 family RNA polymerase sigma factor [Verrucomicrobia bacterium]|nr:sigma-70 family RNA polymerase sigma factor [Verrucomicrobiota bacterium]
MGFALPLSLAAASEVLAGAPRFARGVYEAAGAEGAGPDLMDAVELLPSDADAELLRAVARGDEAALSQLYDRLARILLSVAVRILRDPAAAEDVLQDVFVLIWEKAATYDPRLGKPLTWAVTLTRNKSVDRLRAAQRAGRFVEAATAEMEGDGVVAPAAGEELLSEETASLVRSALMQLPAEQRQAIELAFFGGLTQTEIAAVLRAPLGTVKARIRRGLVQMREALEGCL